MTPEAYTTFVRDNLDEIVKKVIELDNFGDCDIAILKTQITKDGPQPLEGPLAE